MLKFKLKFSESAWTPAYTHHITGTLEQCLARIEDQLQTRTEEACCLTWTDPDGHDVTIWIESNHTFKEVKEKIHAN